MKVGDVVTWRSQAQGSFKTKRGTIVEVVGSGRMPSRERFPSLYKHSGVGLCRDHESYVIEVPRPRSLSYYWPRAKALRLVNGGEEKND